MGAIIPVLRNPSDSALAGLVSSRLNLLLQVAVYAALLPFILRVPGRIVRAALANPALMLLLLFVLMSCGWSLMPFYSFRRALVFAATTVVGLYIGTRFDLREQQRFIAVATVICALLSVLFIVALPHYGTDVGANEGSWRGVFLQKNIFGRYLVLGMITLFCWPTEGVRSKLGKWFVLALSVGLLIGSLSKGSWVVLVVAALLVPLYRLFRVDFKGLMVGISMAAAALGLAAVYVLSNLDAIFSLLGKDATLTARIPIWTTLLTMSQGKRWLGYGYEGFWSTNLMNVTWLLGGFAPGKAHNGFIDLLLEVGVVGLGIFAICAVVAITRAIKVIARERDLQSEWPLLMLSLLLIYNLFESDLMVQNGFIWVLFVALSVSTQRAWSLHAARTRVPRATQLSAAGYEPCPQ